MSIVIQTKFKIGDQVQRIHVTTERGFVEAVDIRYKRTKGEIAEQTIDYQVRWTRKAEDILRWYVENDHDHRPHSACAAHLHKRSGNQHFSNHDLRIDRTFQ